MPAEMQPEAEARTFLAEHYFRRLIESLRRPGAEEERWLADALALLVENAKSFPPPDDADSYVVEYIYPH